MTFGIVVPVYNAADWIGRCLESIRAQTYATFYCVVLDDASTDGTGRAIDALGLDERFSVVRNEDNGGPLRNTWEGFRLLKDKTAPESVLSVVDGDDWLAHDGVLQAVADVYTQSPDCLLTYGNHVRYPQGDTGNCEPFPAQVIRRRAFRKYRYVSSHLRTFRRCLWDALWEADMRDPQTGEFFSCAGDVAFMIPLLELAAPRVRFIEEALYIYNRGNPLNDDVSNQAEQIRVSNYVRSLPKYPRWRGRLPSRTLMLWRHRVIHSRLIWGLLKLRHSTLQRNEPA